jgi:hypothetical protein
MEDNSLDWCMESEMDSLTHAAHPPVTLPVVHDGDVDNVGDTHHNTHDSSAETRITLDKIRASASYPMTGIVQNVVHSDVVAGVALENQQLSARAAKGAESTVANPVTTRDVRRRWSVHPVIPSQLAVDAYRDAKLQAESQVRGNGKSYRSANGINAVRSRMTREIYTALLEQRVEAQRKEVAHRVARMENLRRESSLDGVQMAPHDVQLSELELALATDTQVPSSKKQDEDGFPSRWPFSESGTEHYLDVDASPRILFELPLDDVVGQPPGDLDQPR